MTFRILLSKRGIDYTWSSSWMRQQGQFSGRRKGWPVGKPPYPEHWQLLTWTWTLSHQHGQHSGGSAAAFLFRSPQASPHCWHNHRAQFRQESQLPLSRLKFRSTESGKRLGSGNFGTCKGSRKPHSDLVSLETGSHSCKLHTSQHWPFVPDQTKVILYQILGR